MKIIITESQYRKLILNEQISDKDVYSIYIGYLINLSNSAVTKGPKDMEAVREVRAYYEYLRDGKKPKPSLSDPAKIVDKYVKSEIKKISGNIEELTSLKDLGKKINSKK
jgi:hypothetical protein